MPACLEELGDHPTALAEYEVLARSYPGEQARLRYATLLRKQARVDESRRVLKDMLTRAKLAPRYYRRKGSEWLDAAKRELSSLEQA